MSGGRARPEQEALLAAPASGAADVVPARPDPAATPHGVARVAVDVPHAHLDRPFEYAVPEDLAEQVRPGVRVKVRFSGRDVDGLVLDVVDVPEHPGRLAPLRRVVSTEAVLTPALARVTRAVADRYAGTLADVLRLAIPPRHARAEKALTEREPVPDPTPPAAPDAEAVTAWDRYPAGSALLRRLGAGEAPAAAWVAVPAERPEDDWPRALAEAAAAALRGGRGALLVVPDHRDLDRVDAALGAVLGPGRHVRLSADQGPQARYTAWLRILRGHVRCVVGTRAAAWAPVRDPGLLGWWDDGDDLHEEPRAPYPHTGEVLRIRAGIEGAALLTGGFSRSVGVQWWVDQGTLRAVEATREVTRTAAPRVLVGGEGTDPERDPAGGRGRIPPSAWAALSRALGEGAPVLVQVPRGGYRPALACARCRTPARCSTCQGPLAQDDASAPPTCRWCGTVDVAASCVACDGPLVRGRVVGSRRTAEELGRAFPQVPVLSSGGEHVLAEVGPGPALVVATPGAEPLAAGGYAAVLLLDGAALLGRSGLRSAEEALRRWLAAAALARPAGRGGVIVLAGVPTGPDVRLPAVEALVRWAPVWFAAGELRERRALGLPPTRELAELTGDPVTVTALAESPPAGLRAFGPTPAGPGEPGGHAEVGALRLLWQPERADAAGADTLRSAVRGVRASRSVRRSGGDLRVRVGVLDAG